MDIREYQRYVQIIGANDPVLNPFAVLNTGAKPLLHFDGYLYVGSEDPNTVDRVQISSGNLGSLVNNDGTYEFMCSSGSIGYGVLTTGEINSIDLHNGTVTQITTGNANYRQNGIVKHNGYLYVLNQSDNKIYSINISTGDPTFLSEMPQSGKIVAVDSQLYFCTTSQGILKVNLNTGGKTILTTDNINGNYSAIHGSYLYVTKSNGDIYRINRSTGENSLHLSLNLTTYGIVIINSTTAYVVANDNLYKIDYFF